MIFNFMLDFDVNNATAYQLSSSESNKNKFYNVLSTFADKGWRYTRDGDGECLYKCYYIDGSFDMYRELNEGRTVWNPTDLTKKNNSFLFYRGWIVSALSGFDCWLYVTWKSDF